MAWKPDIVDSDRPKYLALVEALESDIASGRLQAGERLPPQRELAAGLGVTIATITRAIGEANRRGLVAARTGSGTFVRLAPPDGEADVVRDLSLNTVPIAPVKAILDDGLLELAADRRADALLSYQPVAGTERQRRTIAGWFEPRLGRTAANEVALTHGVQHGLSACFAALVRPGDTVVCEAWTYTGVRRLAAISEARLAGARLDAAGLCPDHLSHLLKSTGARVVVCSAAVQNPTTATMPLERRREIVAVCRRADAILVEDDIYGRLSGDPVPALASLDPGRVVYLGGISKCTSPGVRLGFMAAPAQLAADLGDKLAADQWTAPSFFAELFTRLVESGRADRCVDEHRREMDARLQPVRRLFGDKAVPSLPSYHAWLPTPEGWRSDDLVADLLARGVRVSPSTHFAVEEAMGAPNFIRLSLGAVADAGSLLAALRVMASVWNSAPRLAVAIV